MPPCFTTRAAVVSTADLPGTSTSVLGFLQLSKEFRMTNSAYLSDLLLSDLSTQISRPLSLETVPL